MPRRGKEVVMPIEVHQWLIELEELTGIRGKGNVMSYVKNIWGEAIKQHLQSPINTVPGTHQVQTSPNIIPTVTQPPRPKAAPIQANTEPSTDPKTARLAALKNRKIG